MRFFLQPLRPGALDYERLWIGVAFLVLFSVWSWNQLGLPYPGCPFHQWTGLPCLTCRGTRCLTQLAHGHWAAALQWNPGVFLGAISVCLYLLYAAVVVAFRLPRIRMAPLSAKLSGRLRFGAGLLLAANWIYLLLS